MAKRELEKVLIERDGKQVETDERRFRLFYKQLGYAIVSEDESNDSGDESGAPDGGNNVSNTNVPGGEENEPVDAWEGFTVDDLKAEAKAAGVKGYSSMNRGQLIEALEGGQ